MPPESPAAPAVRRPPWVKLAMLGLVLAAGAVLVVMGFPVRAAIDRGMDLIRDAGPAVFFLALTILPAFGAPLMAFTIPAGEAFASRMTLGGVVAAVLACVAVNLALSYWLARYVLRPVLLRVFARYGYKVPSLGRDNALTVTMLVRLTPGPPYFVQSYLLGVAEVPFRTFMVASWLCLVPWAGGAVILGRGMLHGNFREVLAGVGVIGVAVGAVHLYRSRNGRRAPGS